MSVLPPLSGDKQTSGERVATAAFDPEPTPAEAAPFAGCPPDPYAASSGEIAFYDSYNIASVAVWKIYVWSGS
jgi:hypothetical protein